MNAFVLFVWSKVMIKPSNSVEQLKAEIALKLAAAKSGNLEKQPSLLNSGIKRSVTFKEEAPAPSRLRRAITTIFGKTPPPNEVLPEVVTRDVTKAVLPEVVTRDVTKAVIPAVVSQEAPVKDIPLKEDTRVSNEEGPVSRPAAVQVVNAPIVKEYIKASADEATAEKQETPPSAPAEPIVPPAIVEDKTLPADTYSFYSKLFVVNPLVNQPLYIERPFKPFFYTTFHPVTFGSVVNPPEVIPPRKPNSRASDCFSKYKGYFDS